MKPHERARNVLVTSFLIETLCVTFALHATALTPVTSIVYTFCGVLIALCFLQIDAPLVPVRVSLFSFGSAITRYRWLVTAIMLAAMVHFAARWMDDVPLDFHDADMLPIIKTMCERALAGNWTQVYDPIPEIWGGIQPIYLPAMWMPFCLPVGLQLDLRWIVVASLFMVFAIVLWKTDFFQKRAYPILIATFLLFWWIFTGERSGLIPYTEEGIVILYYVLLVIALHSRKAWLIGICVSLCVLSRYALIGWLPVMLIYYAWYRQWKQLFGFVISGIACFLLLVLLPFGWDTFIKHIALPAEYINFTARVWRDSPNVFAESLGMAKFFGPRQISSLHYLLIILSFTVPVLFFVLSIGLQKRYRFAIENIPLAVLKITLVVFYSFIDVPYLYLFYTGSFVSLVGIVYSFSGKRLGTTKRPSTV